MQILREDEDCTTSKCRLANNEFRIVSVKEVNIDESNTKYYENRFTVIDGIKGNCVLHTHHYIREEDGSPKLVIMQKFCSIGSLQTYLKAASIGPPLTEKQVMRVFCQLLHGVYKYHKNLIIHGNLTLKNCFVDSLVFYFHGIKTSEQTKSRERIQFCIGDPAINT